MGFPSEELKVPSAFSPWLVVRREKIGITWWKDRKAKRIQDWIVLNILSLSKMANGTKINNWLLSKDQIQDAARKT